VKRMYSRKLIIVTIVVFFISMVSAYGDKLIKEEWEKTLCKKGNLSQRAYSIIETKDHAYLAAGSTSVPGKLVSSKNAWIVKFDKSGKIQWDRIFGDKHESEAFCVIQTRDGSYAFTGYCSAKDNRIDNDIWVVKLDVKGSLQWEKSFGAKNDDKASSIIQTKDGGYVVVGYSETEPKSGKLKDVKKNIWILKLDANGNKQWDKKIGREDRNDKATAVVLAHDNGYVVAGYTASEGKGWSRFWVVKFDEKGNSVWKKSFENNFNHEYALSLISTQDGGYMLAGYTWSDSFGKKMKVYKISATGDLQWDRSYADEFGTLAYSITQIEDGGYLLAGKAEHFVKVLESNGKWSTYYYPKILLLRLSAEGKELWSQDLGKGDPRSIIKTKEGKYIMAGLRLTSSIPAKSDKYFMIMKFEIEK